VTRVAARFDLFTVKKEGVTMDAKMSELAACACECLALQEFVDNWNRLRPEYPIKVNAPTSPMDFLVDKSTGAPPVIWSPETRTRFFQFVESHVRRPVLEKAIQELKLEPR
jgi:hypothetical protein